MDGCLTLGMFLVFMVCTVIGYGLGILIVSRKR